MFFNGNMTQKKKTIVKFMCVILLLSFLPLTSTGFSSQSFDDDYVYHTYDSMSNLLQSLYQNHSDICQLVSLDKTFEGRDILLMKISDNPKLDENEEPAVLLMGAHHGNEKPSFESLIFFINYILQSYASGNVDNDGDGLVNEDIFDGYDNDHDGKVDEDPSEEWIQYLIDNTEIYVIPMVNPDGVEYNWRKNRAPNYGPFGTKSTITSYGVDLNRNYDYRWNLPYLLPINYMLPFIINDESWNYRGEKPFSEIETRAVRDFVLDHPNIKISLSYHSYSCVIMYPWTHTSLDTPDESLFLSIGQNMSKIDKYELLTHGWRNRTYLIPRFSGTIGTSENWLYGTQGILSFTVELCDSRAPIDPLVVQDYCLKHVGVNLYVAERSLTID